ncbi:helix-turn-helix domain-containing protein [Parvularcula dongshanensis]|uniref:Transcriptional regulator with XRE-family HTH domain n=1 Tax=Parvularcula dongshanensis TaxID=1173995 RepID=A0A840I3P4_9PROT|nr:helix-turn-helix transcriptional regulator [Parvularcula dongshanensis]MBB4659626.1 transcriptional regulator with XRE-family HTH domain [Parvularcula dongshanensis]
MARTATPCPATPPHEVDLRVGQNLRSARNMRGLTQKALGEAVGLTLQQIQKYENGSNRINVSRLHQFSEVLKVPVSHFFSGPAADLSPRSAEPAPGAGAPGGLRFSAEDFELLTLFKTLSPRLKRRMICLVEEMAEPRG